MAELVLMVSRPFGESAFAVWSPSAEAVFAGSRGSHSPGRRSPAPRSPAPQPVNGHLVLPVGGLEISPLAATKFSPTAASYLPT
ncbi:hypothetical protein, partial [Microbispora sp. CSR-4]|uniref:hypothetical protein n=1 Tax=Microbispora sp. CSR-4 TaxID=2592813 RepID=UPI001C9D4A1A